MLKSLNGLFTFIKKHPLLILVVLVVVAIPSAFAYNYVNNDPKFCTTCHLMNEAFSTWNASAMHGLNCHTCHESDMLVNLGHVVSVITENKAVVTKPVKIDNQLCENCHASDDPKWLQVVNTDGHNVHLFNGTVSANCIDCHGTRLHAFRPPQEICVECHPKDKQIAEKVMDTHCTGCHEFLATEGELIPKEEKCLQCHENKTTTGASFPGNAHNATDCINCHDPHKENIFPNCTSCHTQGGGLHNIPAHVNCNSCHIPHDGATLRQNCLSCHPDKKQHYESINECSKCHSFSK
jgi:hypothetical protein